MGVDDRSNTLIVSAPRDLMGIINEIADELDRAAGESRGVVEVLNLGAASTAVQQILSGVSKPPVTANNKEPAPEANGEKAAAPKAPAGRTEMFVVPN
jgi:type II secretory pathway component GspD/PulD (secretin)